LITSPSFLSAGAAASSSWIPRDGGDRGRQFRRIDRLRNMYLEPRREDACAVFRAHETR